MSMASSKITLVSPSHSKHQGSFYSSDHMQQSMSPIYKKSPFAKGRTGKSEIRNVD